MRIASGLLVASYPFLIFAGLRWLAPREVAALLAFALLARVALRWRRPTAAELARLALPAFLVGCVLAAAWVTSDPRFLLFVPVLVNLALLAAFARSLLHGPPLVETFARLQHSDFSAAELRHCRNVTVLWCAFFAVNAAVCAGLAATGELWWWTLYTGGIAYGLMGLLLAGEFVFRAWKFQRYAGSLAEPLFRRLFPRRPPP